MIKITINNQQVEVEEKTTILQAAEKLGIFIPTLCHQPDLKPFASCWICIVEVKGAKGFVPACSTEVVDGMVIETDSDNVRDARKLGLELLFSNHYADCFPPCSLACPAEVDAQGYISLVANGQYQEAVDIVRVTNPFPVVCGLVCPAPCENACRRNIVDQPVSIRALKRVACDHAEQTLDIRHQTSDSLSAIRSSLSANRVAVVGAGPAGLTCAYYLAKKGFSVTVFESMPEPGGMLRYGIPEYRLPKKDLKRDIDNILSAGVELKTNQILGKDFTLQSLFDNGYKTIFVSVGAQLSQKLNVEGENFTGVYGGVDFLREVNSGKKIGVCKNVVIIGGGNTAIDSARTALRLGAEEVTIVYRRTRNEMPAHAEEIDQAEYEGVKIKYLSAPVRIVGENNKVKSLRCQQMKLCEPDASGRRCPKPVPDSEFEIFCDTIIAAIGQQTDLTFLSDYPVKSGNEIIKRGNIVVNKTTLQNEIPGLFAGGDVVTGPATAVEAIGMGRRAAVMIDRYLRTQNDSNCHRSEMFIKESFNVNKGFWRDINPDEFNDEPRIPRYEIPMLPLEKRNQNQRQTELGYDKKTGINEALRCLECGCMDLYECKFRDLGMKYGVNLNRYPGAISKHPIDDSHPFIRHEQNKCILCGRCVRTCTEIQGSNALNFFYRGFVAVVGLTVGQKFSEIDCSSCGQCVYACPTGALTEKMGDMRMGPWMNKKTVTVCPNCSLGCGIALETKGNKIVRTVSQPDFVVNQQYLCDKGKFGYDFVNDEKRLKVPYIKVNSKLKKTSFDNAAQEIVNRLRKVVEKHGANSAAVIISPRNTNEEITLAKQFAADVLKTKNFLSLELIHAKPPKSTEYSILDTAKNIVIIKSNLEMEHPVLQTKLHKLRLKGINITSFTDVDNLVVAQFVGHDLSETVIVTNQDNFSIEQWAKFTNILQKYGFEDKTVVLNKCVNTRGLQKIGTLVDKDTFLSELKNGRIKAIYVLGELPELTLNSELLVVQDLVVTKTAKSADIILPAASLVEVDGTITNSEGRVQKLFPAFAPVCGYTNIEILQKVIDNYRISF